MIETILQPTELILFSVFSPPLPAPSTPSPEKMFHERDSRLTTLGIPQGPESGSCAGKVLDRDRVNDESASGQDQTLSK